MGHIEQQEGNSIRLTGAIYGAVIGALIGALIRGLCADQTENSIDFILASVTIFIVPMVLFFATLTSKAFHLVGKLTLIALLAIGIAQVAIWTSPPEGYVIGYTSIITMAITFSFYGSVGGALLAGSITKRSEQRLENLRIAQEEKRRQEEEVIDAARIKREKDEIVNLFNQTLNAIEEAISNAIDNGDNLGLKALLILKENSYLVKEEFIRDSLSYIETKELLLDLKKRTEILNSPYAEEKARGNTSSELDYYQVLGIRRDATLEQIKSIYRKLAFIYHPDTGKTLGVDSDQRFRQIKEAYEVLIDPVKRKEYDTKI